MKYFLLFCAIYSVSLFADNPKKLDKAKRSISETADQVKKALGSKQK